ncbi:solute carrier family 15 member 2-like [Ischnura elegans]|uniref:solute carrier family 15 member 2-like n=1 Tax=Ischnura elegans TaxID=197161 RepID=UPI001ED8A5CE|nr:solute carrier family 15 member 2-like [Ischnura elegans]
MTMSTEMETEMVSPKEVSTGEGEDVTAPPTPEKKSDDADDGISAKDGTIMKYDKMKFEDGTESQKKPTKYPRSVFFIVSNEFCERFTFYGIRTILAIYLSNILSFSENDATVIYHAFVLVTYFTPLLGAMIADSLLGRFRTIFYVSIIYIIGNIVMSVGATPDLRSAATAMTMIGLVLIALGTGGIKPCVSSFGGDQFVLPEQEKQQKQFFSIFYFAINSGSLISTFLTPVLRQDVKCLGEDSCYSLAFGVPAIFMVISLALFLLGKSMYVIKKPEGNLLLQLCKLMNHAVVNRIKHKGPKKDHWLDYASDKFDQKLIDDTKSAFKVLALFVPLPFFWALFDQQGSRWTFQALQMDGVMGSFTLAPDQMQVVNPLLILAFIPLFETVIYPLFAKCRLLTTSIPRIFVGGCLAGVAFALSGLVDLQIEGSLAVIPGAGEGQLRIFNGLSNNCTGNLSMGAQLREIEIPAMGQWRDQKISVQVSSQFSVSMICGSDGNFTGHVSVLEEKAVSYVIGSENGALDIFGYYIDSVEKSQNGFGKIRVLYNGAVDSAKNISFRNDDRSLKETVELVPGMRGTNITALAPAEYNVFVDDLNIGNLLISQGGVYALLVRENGNSYEIELEEITPFNNIHMMWLVPQYAVITAGEIMFSITGLEFAFTQAPASMKSVVSAMWLFTDSIGNLIIIIIAELKIFDKQAYEYFLYAGIMIAVMFIFLWMAWNFQYVQVHERKEDLEIQADAVITATEN